MKTDLLQSFWRSAPRLVGEHGAHAVMTGGMSDDDSRREIDALLSLLPPLGAGDAILEPSAGVGRFTPHLARGAGRVDASDLVPAFAEENAKRCAALPNVRVVAADARALDVGAGAYALVFVNWLFLYLDDADTRALATRFIAGLRPGGHLFLRESCQPARAVPAGGSAASELTEPWLGETYRAVYRPARFYRELLVAIAGSRFASLREHDLAPLFEPDDATDQRAWSLELA